MKPETSETFRVQKSKLPGEIESTHQPPAGKEAPICTNSVIWKSHIRLQMRTYTRKIPKLQYGSPSFLFWQDPSPWLVWHNINESTNRQRCTATNRRAARKSMRNSGRTTSKDWKRRDWNRAMRNKYGNKPSVTKGQNKGNANEVGLMSTRHECIYNERNWWCTLNQNWVNWTPKYQVKKRVNQNLWSWIQLGMAGLWQLDVYSAPYVRSGHEASWRFAVNKVLGSPGYILYL